MDHAHVIVSVYFSLVEKDLNQSTVFIDLIDTTKSIACRSRREAALKPGNPYAPSEKVKTKYRRQMLRRPEVWEYLSFLFSPQVLSLLYS